MKIKKLCATEKRENKVKLKNNVDDPFMFNLLTSGLGLAGVVLAERTATLREEALSFEVLLAAGAVEALTVVVVVQRLHPLVAGLDGESAGEALGREQLVPVGLAVRVTLLQEERAVAELLAAVRALEALRVELLADGVEAVALHAGVALAADRGQELLEAVLAVQVTLLLDEADVGQRALAVAVVADEVIRAPDATQSGDEWSSDLLTAAATQWDTTARGNGLVHDTTAAGGRCGLACRAALVERCGTLWSWHSGSRRGGRGHGSWGWGRSRSLNGRGGGGLRGRRIAGWLGSRGSWGRSLASDGRRERRRNASGHWREGRRRLNQRARSGSERFRSDVVLVIGGVGRLGAAVQIGVGIEGGGDGLDSGFLSKF